MNHTHSITNLPHTQNLPPLRRVSGRHPLLLVVPGRIEACPGQPYFIPAIAVIEAVDGGRQLYQPLIGAFGEDALLAVVGGHQARENDPYFLIIIAKLLHPTA